MDRSSINPSDLEADFKPAGSLESPTLPAANKPKSRLSRFGKFGGAVAVGIAELVGIHNGVADAASLDKPAASYAEPFTATEQGYEAMATEPTFERIAGSNRIQTAIKVSQEMNPDGNKKVYFLANGTKIADAIAAGPASALRGFPMLLTGGKSLEKENLDELRRGTAHTIEGTPGVYILGGTGAISAEEENQLRAAGFLTERLGGVDRFDTAEIINRKFFGTTADTIWLANGLVDVSKPAGWADAIGAAGLAGTNDRINGATTGAGMFLPTKGAQVTPRTRMLIQETLNQNPNTKVIAMDALAAQAWPNAWRSYTTGTTIDRIIKAVREIAPEYRNGRYGFARVDDPADALASTGLISIQGNLFLVPRDGSLPAALKTFLEETGPESLREGIVLGGTGAISESMLQQISTAAGVS